MMKSKAFSILTGVALVLSAPLVAQSSATTAKPPAVEVQNDSLDVDVDLKDSKGNIDPEVDVKTGAAARADVDTAATDENDNDRADINIDRNIDRDTDELPRTASPLALLALLGLGAGSSALGLRRLRRN